MEPTFAPLTIPIARLRKILSTFPFKTQDSENGLTAEIFFGIIGQLSIPQEGVYSFKEKPILSAVGFLQA